MYIQFWALPIFYFIKDILLNKSILICIVVCHLWKEIGQENTIILFSHLFYNLKNGKNIFTVVCFQIFFFIFFYPLSVYNLKNCSYMSTRLHVLVTISVFCLQPPKKFFSNFHVLWLFLMDSTQYGTIRYLYLIEEPETERAHKLFSPHKPHLNQMNHMRKKVLSIH